MLALWSGGERVVRGKRLDERGRATLPPVPLELRVALTLADPVGHAADTNHTW